MGGVPWGGFAGSVLVCLTMCTTVCETRRLGSGAPHREPSVLHVIVEAVVGDLGASQVSSQLSGECG